MSVITQSCTSSYIPQFNCSTIRTLFPKFPPSLTLWKHCSCGTVRRMGLKSIYLHKLRLMHNTVLISHLWKDVGDDCGRLLCFGEAALASSRTFPTGFLSLGKGLLLCQCLISKEIRLETEWKLHRQLRAALPPPPAAFSIFHFTKQESQNNSQIAVYLKRIKLWKLAELSRPLPAVSRAV